MKEKIRDNLPHLILAILETAGLLLPLLGLFGLSSSFVSSLLLSAGLLVILELSRLNRGTALAAPIVLTVSFLVWLFMSGGMTVVKDIMLGITLHFNGIPASLILVGAQTAVLLSVVLACLVFWVSVPDAGGIFLFLLSLFVFILIWYFDRFDLLWDLWQIRCRNRFEEIL